MGDTTDLNMNGDWSQHNENSGMNDTDFASLFVGSNIPPKFARNDYYEEYKEENVTENEDVKEEHSEEPVTESESEELLNDAQEKKAYVDSFFSYLYDESVFDQPIEMPGGGER